MINSNLRFLRVHQGSYYMKNGLCEACGRSPECSARSAEIQCCKVYQPVLLFRSLEGTEGEFNTFRLGHSWSTRVQPGSTVGLVDKSGERIAEAEVQHALLGPTQLMLDEHAAANHLILAGGYEDASSRLERILCNLYGRNFLERAGCLSVVYLRRL